MPATPRVAKGPGRRTFLASTAVAAAAVTGGMPPLTARGGSAASGDSQGAASGPELEG